MSSAAPAVSSPRVYLDLDVDGHQAAYQRACEFVAATNFKYGWSSQVLADLGGSERSRIQESYASDFEWSGKGRIELTPAAHTRLEIALYSEAAPNCADNFLHLCVGDKGKAKGSGVPLRYAGSHFHRYLPGQILQGGDFAHSNGSGGESIWGGRFKDDKAALKIKHSKRGLLSMCNTGSTPVAAHNAGARLIPVTHHLTSALVADLHVLRSQRQRIAGQPPALAQRPARPSV